MSEKLICLSGFDYFNMSIHKLSFTITKCLLYFDYLFIILIVIFSLCYIPLKERRIRNYLAQGKIKNKELYACVVNACHNDWP